ncbi:MAG: TadE/TadG family type IV pilus assembly protein, partial [Candidatus Tectimicrobiota bacterium]
MRQWVRRLFSADGGNASVELAVVLPFLLATALGIVEFGRVLYYQQVLTNAAR